MSAVKSLFKKKRKVYKKGFLEEIHFNFALKDEEYWTKEDLKLAKDPAERARLKQRLLRIHAAQEKEAGKVSLVQVLIPSNSFDVLDFIEDFHKKLENKKAKKLKEEPFDVFKFMRKLIKVK